MVTKNNIFVKKQRKTAYTAAVFGGSATKAVPVNHKIQKQNICRKESACFFS